MNKQGILTMLGFAQKAGKLAAGEAAVENFLKKQKIVLIVVSEEISENRMIFWKRQAEFYNVPLVTVDIEKIDLGWAIGSSPKTVIGIMDQGMADAVRKKIAE
ncbi:MAG: ribosomal L7Ae/L30e/S12e/Gadd45 family protein [Peptococcaceae bacterium]|nr:ribosomal L7Ae/L30e/S12e/Gadd45 family protein [Peptococcaceae bacterium]